jgi:hypothetical protein
MQEIPDSTNLHSARQHQINTQVLKDFSDNCVLASLQRENYKEEDIRGIVVVLKDTKFITEKITIQRL